MSKQGRRQRGKNNPPPDFHRFLKFLTQNRYVVEPAAQIPSEFLTIPATRIKLPTGYWVGHASAFAQSMERMKSVLDCVDVSNQKAPEEDFLALGVVDTELSARKIGAGYSGEPETVEIETVLKQARGGSIGICFIAGGNIRIMTPDRVRDYCASTFRDLRPGPDLGDTPRLDL